MIKTTVFENSIDSGDAVYTRIVVEGYAGYTDEGEDITCAAASILALNFFNSVEVLTEDGFEGGAGENGSSEFRFISDISPESKLLMSFLVLGLQSTERDYGKSYTSVEFKGMWHVLETNLRLFARKKGAGSTKSGRDSEARRPGARRADGQFVLADNILYRQRRTHICPDNNVGRGGDDALFTLVDGAVEFERKDRDRKQAFIYPGAINE